MTYRIKQRRPSNADRAALHFIQLQQRGMPIEIKIPKEISEYQESVFFGLSLRQFVCSLLAVAAAVGLYFLLDHTAGAELAGWASVLGAAPFAACGFVRYHGMTAEQTLCAILRSEVFTPHRLMFKGGNVYYTVLAERIAAGAKHPSRETEVAA